MNLIPEDLDALIQEYLTDGVLTDKERAVILKKAEGMGLGRDEIDLYLDAQVQKIDQAADAVVRRQKSKACPYCGAPIPQLTDKCPECGQFITPEASSELQDILENLEDALVDLKAGNDISRSKASVERYKRKAQLYYGSNPKIQKLLIEIDNEMMTAENKIVNEKRRSNVLWFIKNPWIWLVLEILIFVAITSIYRGSIDKAAEQKNDIISKMELHPEYEKYGYFGFDKVRPDNSEEYNQLVEEYKVVYKKWDESHEGLASKQRVLLLFIVITIIWGIILLVRRKK